MSKYIIALDQGTTSSRAVIYDENGIVKSFAQKPLTQHYPRPGWVEHDPEEIIKTLFEALSEAFKKSGVKRSDIAAVGITNQRETSVVWEKDSGRSIYNAIVWQCRRTADTCEELKKDGMGAYIQEKTGLLIDAYFSATKFKWILDNVGGAKSAVEKANLLCGTIESWIVYNLTKGRVHVSDYSNASRTMLFDIDRLEWDELLLKSLGIPEGMLPYPVCGSEKVGEIAAGICGIEALEGVPVCALIGDQPSALFGQGCFEKGQAKNTYGTGCFMLMNTGSDSVRSKCGLVTSVGWSVAGNTSYALEGSVFNAGSVVQWLRDEMGLINSSAECESVALSVKDNAGVYFVPAFNGLGAPYWDMYARGIITGLTRGSGKAHIVRAALESMAYQSADLMLGMQKDSSIKISELRVDGGACVNNFIMQLQSDITDTVINRPVNIETTSAGAAYLAGLSCGLYGSFDEIQKLRITERIFVPSAESIRTKDCFEQWHNAVNRAKSS